MLVFIFQIYKMVCSSMPIAIFTIFALIAVGYCQVSGDHKADTGVAIPIETFFPTAYASTGHKCIDRCEIKAGSEYPVCAIAIDWYEGNYTWARCSTEWSGAVDIESEFYFKQVQSSRGEACKDACEVNESLLFNIC